MNTFTDGMWERFNYLRMLIFDLFITITKCPVVITKYQTIVLILADAITWTLKAQNVIQTGNFIIENETRKKEIMHIIWHFLLTYEMQ